MHKRIQRPQSQTLSETVTNGNVGKGQFLEVRNVLENYGIASHSEIDQSPDLLGSQLSQPPTIQLGITNFAGQGWQDAGEESRAESAVERSAESDSLVSGFSQLLDDRPLPAGPVASPVRDLMEPTVGPLPSDLTLRTGSDVDRELNLRGARGLATDNEVWVGGSSLAPFPGGFANVFLHEVAHVASGGSKAPNPPHFDGLEPPGGGWLEAAQERTAALEKAETGEGRKETLKRLVTMSDDEARNDTPGIAYRAHDRGDIELANTAVQRLLKAWLASSDAPVSYREGFGTDDKVDVLLDRAEKAVKAGHVKLFGSYLSVAIVQLARAANVAVLQRIPPSDNPGLETARQMLQPLQEANETDIFLRVFRVREMLESHGITVMGEGTQAEIDEFEAVAESVFSAERQAAPPIAEDLGKVAEFDSKLKSDQPSGSGRGRDQKTPPAPATTSAATPSLKTPTPEPAAPVSAEPVPEPKPPVSRAGESIVNKTHPHLEKALVFYRSKAPRVYGNIRSPRYAIAGTLAGANRFAAELFGRRSSVIVEDLNARDPATKDRQVRYLVLALDTTITPPNPQLGEGGKTIGYEHLQMLAQPANPGYFFLSLAVPPWNFFHPALHDRILQIKASEAKVTVPKLSDEVRRQAVFDPIDQLINKDDIQEASDQLSYMGAEGFELVDTETKIKYITTMLKAFTFELHEKTIVEVFRSLKDKAELRQILHGLHKNGVLRKLRSDMESSISSLLLAVGQRVGSKSLSPAQVQKLLSELKISGAISGIEIRADGSVTLKTDLVDEFVTAIEELINTIKSAVTGIIDILMDPQAFVEGIAKLIYFAVMLDLASKGYPPAVEYVSNLTAAIGRQIGIAMSGLSALQENMPEGVEFVRGLQRSVEWRIIWEILGLFIGVGEAVALIDAIRGGRAVAALGEVGSGLSKASKARRALDATDEAADAARTARKGSQTTQETVDATRRAPDELAPNAKGRGTVSAADNVPESNIPGRILREQQVTLGEGRVHRVVVTRIGDTTQIWMCSHCGRFIGRINEALDVVSPTGPTKSLHTRLTKMRDKVAELESELARKTKTVDDLPRELNQIGAHLRDLSNKFPDVKELLGFRNLPISPEMRRFIRKTKDPATHIAASSYTRGKHVRGATNEERKASSMLSTGRGRRPPPSQYLAELEDGTKVTDATITAWERKALQMAREGKGRVVGSGSTYHCYVDLEITIGYVNGTPTSVLRVEWSVGNVHSHPRPMSDLNKK